MDASSNGILYVVGLGPGSPGLLAPEAARVVSVCDTIVGFRGYLDQIATLTHGKQVFAMELGDEVERAGLALELAGSGHAVSLVSSGDAGIYGMAGVAFELAARRSSKVEIVVVPGITAACSAAAKLGAPLAHDWACVSLSDLLTPWETITRRVESAARGDFVLVFYNPASRTRDWQLASVARVMLEHRDPATPVGLVKNAFRPGEEVQIIPLEELATASVDMLTTVIIGNHHTFVDRGRMVTPRIEAAKRSEREGAAATRNEGAKSEPWEPIAVGASIMAQSLAMIDSELGERPVDPAERAVVRRMIHASADFDFAKNVRFSEGSIQSAIDALREGASIVTDVEMLRSGIRRDLAGRLNVRVVCGLNDPEALELARSDGLTRTAAGLRLAALKAGDRAIVAIGNAPTALREALSLVERGRRPACIVGIPVGFVAVAESKCELLQQAYTPYITSVGRKGGTAVTAAAVNALLAMAVWGSGHEPE